jgi:DNA-binding protein H-NS
MLMRYTLPSRKLMVAAALITVAVSWLATLGRAQQRRLKAKPRSKPEHLQTWEGEGGAIPTPDGRTVAQVPPVVLNGETPNASAP